MSYTSSSRKVLDVQEVCHRWANQRQESARNSGNTLYFEGATIYSYGSHFPIASHHGDKVIFTTRSYSRTTSKHIAYVGQACSHIDRIYCFRPDYAVSGFHNENIDHFCTAIEELLNNLSRARKPEIYIESLNRERENIQAYVEHFNVVLTDSQLARLNSEDMNQLRESHAKHLAALEEKTAQACKAGEPIYKAYVEAFHNFNERDFGMSITVSQRGNAEVYKAERVSMPELLRTDGESLYTSKGIEMPIGIAKRYYAFYKRIQAQGGCDWTNQYKIIGYKVTSVNEAGLIVGCHSIAASEIEYIATKLNW